MSPVTELHEPEILEQIPRQVVTSKLAVALTIEPRLFADVLLELDSTKKRRRGWAAVSSVLLQSVVVGSLLVVPLMFTEALPIQQLLTFLLAPPPPPPPPPAAAALRGVRRVETDLIDAGLRMPSRIPQKVQRIREDQALPPLASGMGVIGGVVGGIPGGQLGGVIGGIISSTASTIMVPKLAATPKRIRFTGRNHRTRELVRSGSDLCFRANYSAAFGRAEEQILRFADVHGAGLIVLGVRAPQGALNTLTHLAHSKSQQIVACATCPVLTVRG